MGILLVTSSCGNRRPQWLIAANTLVQDYSDGGVRALHPTLFTESLRLTWIRKLLDPSPQLWKNIVWEHLSDTSGVLGQGELLLASSLDFSHLPAHTPRFVKALFSSWGGLCTPRRSQPTTYEAVLREPVTYNPIARKDESFASNRFRTFGRAVGADSESLRSRQWSTAHAMATIGFRTVRDMLPFLRITRHGRLYTLAIRADALRTAYPRDRNVVPFFRAVTEAWPDDWLHLLFHRQTSYTVGTWVRWSSAQRPRYGRVVAILPGPVYRVRVFIMDRLRRLHDTGTDVMRNPDSRLDTGVAWRGFLSARDQRLADDIEFGHGDGTPPCLLYMALAGHYLRRRSRSLHHDAPPRSNPLHTPSDSACYPS